MKLTTPKQEPHGYPTFKFSQIKDSITGRVTQISDFPVTQPAIEKDRPDVDNLVFEVTTDKPVKCKDQFGNVTEGTEWTLWVRHRSQQYRAIFAALQPHGGEMLEGGKITISFVSTEPIKNRPTPRKIFEVAYEPPDESAQTGDDEEPF